MIVHEYVALDLERVVEALDRLGPVERFHGVVYGMLDDEPDA